MSVGSETSNRPLGNSCSAIVQNVSPHYEATVVNLLAHEATIRKVGRAYESTFMMGTLAGGSFRDQLYLLKAEDADRIAAKEAFDQLKALTRAIPEYNSLEGMFIDCDHMVATLFLEDGSRKELTLGELKKKLIATQPPSVEIEKIIGEAFRKFDTAFYRMGISTISHYSPLGPDTLASAAGGEALQITRHSAPYIQYQQAADLTQDAKKDKYNILSLIERGSFQNKQEQNQALDRVLQAEAFLLKFRDDLTEKITQLTAEHALQTTLEKKQKLKKKVQELTRLRDDLLKANRHALWVGAMYQDPKTCFEWLLHDYYESCYERVDDPIRKPSFQSFIASADSLPYRRHAAEIASLQITDPVQYRLFCKNYGIEPRDHHVNRLLYVALKDKEPKNIDLGTFGYAFDPEAGQEVLALITEARQKTSQIATQLNHHASPEEGARERLKTALKAKEIFAYLRDAQTAEKSGISRLVTWVKGKFS